ncbi:hypothetical protein [Pelagibacterium sp.]
MSLQEAMDQGFEAVKQYVDAEFADLDRRLKALEQGDKPRVRMPAGKSKR